MDEKTFQAFTNIVKVCVADFGDICKDDLILIGLRLGTAEPELKEQFPELYEREEEAIDELEELDKEEEESLVEESDIEIE